MTGCWGSDITQGPAVDLALSPRLAGLMGCGRYSPPSSCSLALSLFCDTHSSLALSLYTPFSSRILTQSSARASRRQLAAAEERAGRQLQPPLQQIVPPVPWKLSGQVAEGMEGRAAGQVGPAVRNLLRHKSYRFSPISSSFCCFTFSHFLLSSFQNPLFFFPLLKTMQEKSCFCHCVADFFAHSSKLNC